MGGEGDESGEGGEGAAWGGVGGARQQWGAPTCAGTLPHLPGSAPRAGEQAPGARGRRRPTPRREFGPGCGAGGKVAKGTSVRVVEADAERVVVDGGQQFAHAELLGRVWMRARSTSTCGTSTSGPAVPPALSC